MSSKTNSGIQTASDGSAFVPASRRADGSVRKEIKVRPGFKPSEDIATSTPAAWKDRKAGGVPGADVAPKATEPEPMSKNAKRREAARKKAASSPSEEDQLAASMQDSGISEINKLKADWRDLSKLAVNDVANDREAEKLKKIRNTLKKLKAVRELKEKKSAGEKLSPWRN
jgi:partner of Y14 and mago